jgi:hypothetical protein
MDEIQRHVVMNSSHNGGRPESLFFVEGHAILCIVLIVVSILLGIVGKFLLLFSWKIWFCVMSCEIIFRGG